MIGARVEGDDCKRVTRSEAIVRLLWGCTRFGARLELSVWMGVRHGNSLGKWAKDKLPLAYSGMRTS